MDQFVIVIEDEEKIQEVLFTTLKKINPILKVRFFDKLESFSAWVATVIKDGPQSLELGGFRWKNDKDVETVDAAKRLNLIVCKNEILGTQSISLLQKTTDLLLRKNLCSEEEMTSIVLTAFDHSTVSLKSMEEKFINNVIYKPFDLLILEEHLRYAVIGRKKPKDDNLKNSKLVAQIEMVKDVPIKGFSDLGFLSISDSPLKIGNVAKFYADEFLVGNTKSTMARCVKVEPNPDVKNTFLCWMEYFAMDAEQVKKFRKDFFVDFPATLISQPKTPFKLNIIYFDSFSETELPSSLKRFFPEANIHTYNRWEDFEFDYNPEKSEMITDKDLPGDKDVRIHIDPTGHFFLEFTDLGESESLFGDNISSLRTKDFQSLLDIESKKKWLEIFRTQKIEAGNGSIFVFHHNNKKFLVRLQGFKKTKTKSDQPSIELVFGKLIPSVKSSFLTAMSPLGKKVDLIIGSEYFFKICIKKNYYPIEAKILISKNNFTDNEEKYWAQFVRDVMYIPIDRSYLAKKIFLTFADKKLWSKDYFTIKEKEIQTAQQIQLDEVSEAGLFFKYHRALSIGSFRRFYLWTPDETKLLDYHANCNYTEEVKEQKGSFLHHFVFFGMKDLYLKNIRLWVRENYIQNKNKG